MSAKNDLTIPLLPDKYYHIYNRGINKANIFFNDENYRYFLDKFSMKMNGYFDIFGYCLLSNHFHLMIRVKSLDELFSNAIRDFEHINESFYKDYVLPWLSRIGRDLTKQDLTKQDLTKQDLTKQDLTNFKNLLDLSLSLSLSLDPSITNRDTKPKAPGFPLDLDEVDFRTQLASWVVSERFRGFLLGYAKAINKQETRTGSLFQKGFRRKYIMDDIRDRKTVLMYIHHNPIHHFYAESYDDYTWSSYDAYLTDTKPIICRDEALAWFGGRSEYLADAVAYKNGKRTNYDWMIDEE